MNYNFFCENCHRLLLVSKKPTQNQEMTCPLCNIVYFSNEMIEKGTFFLIFNSKKRIQNLINIQRTSLLQNLEKIAQKTGQVLSDITDGHLVRLTRKKLGCALHDLTASISTDRSPIFKSSKLSMWPVHIMINELPTITRWQNLLIGELWFGKGKSYMFLFLNAFVEQFNAIETILWKCFQTGQTLSTKIYMVCCIADAPARAAVMNRKQFNGYYGCPWCYQRGTLVQGVVKYPFAEHQVERTHKGVLQDMKSAALRNEPVRAWHIWAVPTTEAYRVRFGLGHCSRLYALCA